jgi:hypothetical protein
MVDTSDENLIRKSDCLSQRERLGHLWFGLETGSMTDCQCPPACTFKHYRSLAG